MTTATPAYQFVLNMDVLELRVHDKICFLLQIFGETIGC